MTLVAWHGTGRLPALAAIILAFAAVVPARSQSTVLFVVSDPLGARIEIDNARVGNRTPFIVRDLPPGIHRVLVHRDGYATMESRIELAPGERRVLDVALSARSFVAGVFDEHGWLLHEREAGAGLLRLPDGAYLADRVDGTRLQVRPRYGLQRFIDALNLVIPVLTGFTGALSLREAAGNDGSGPALSPFVVTAWVLDAALLGADVALHLDRQRFLDSFAAEPLAEDPSLARPLFDQAEQELAAGRFDAAIGLFTRLVEKHPDSPHACRALYTRGRLSLMLGQRDAAMADLRRFVDELPLPSLYDRAQLQLAGLHLEGGDTAACLASLDAMLFIDAAVDREEVDWLRGQAMLQSTRSGTGGAETTVAWLRGLLERYPASASLDDYRLTLAEVLAEAGRTAECIVVMELLPADAEHGPLADRLRRLRERLGR